MPTLPPVWWMDDATYSALSKQDKKKVSKALADYEKAEAQAKIDEADARQTAIDTIIDVLP